MKILNEVFGLKKLVVFFLELELWCNKYRVWSLLDMGLNRGINWEIYLIYFIFSFVICKMEKIYVL